MKKQVFTKMEGRPVGDPDAKPITLLIDPGSAPASTIADLLEAVSELSFCLSGNQMQFKVAGSVSFDDES